MAETKEQAAVRMREWRRTHPRTNAMRVAARENARRWRKNNPAKVKIQNRRDNLKKNYDLSTEQYEAMIVAHEGKCHVCKQPPTGRWKRLHVDHDHSTGVIRGLLCSGCNLALGHVRDNPQTLRDLATYLEASREH